MLTTSNLLTAFMLGGWLAIAPAAIAANATYSVHQGNIQGSASLGELRMAGSVPTLSSRSGLRRQTHSAQHVASQARLSGKSSYAGLNQ